MADIALLCTHLHMRRSYVFHKHTTSVFVCVCVMYGGTYFIPQRSVPDRYEIGIRGPISYRQRKLKKKVQRWAKKWSLGIFGPDLPGCCLAKQIHF